MAEREMPEKDIAAVIRLVYQQIPEVEVTQLQKKWPDDDDSLWWFSLPEVKPNLQIESYSCPFLIETNEQCCGKALKAETVDEAVSMVVTYLKALRKSQSIRLDGQLWWPEETRDEASLSSDQ